MDDKEKNQVLSKEKIEELFKKGNEIKEYDEENSNEFYEANGYITELMENISETDYREYFNRADNDMFFYPVYKFFFKGYFKEEEKTKINELKELIGENSLNRIFYSVVKFYKGKSFFSFYSYEICIKDLCYLFARYSDVKDILEDGIKKEFANLLAFCIRFSGDWNDYGYAYGGLDIVRENIKFINDENVIIDILNYFESITVWQNEVHKKQLRAIIYNNIFIESIDKFKLFYLDRRESENIINNILKHEFYKYKEYNIIDDDDRGIDFENRSKKNNILKKNLLLLKTNNNQIKLYIEYKDFTECRYICEYNSEKNILLEGNLNTDGIESTDCDNIYDSQKYIQKISDILNNKNINEIDNFVEILYLWIDEYNMFSDREMCFNRNYKFYYKKEEKTLNFNDVGELNKNSFFYSHEDNAKSKIRNLNGIIGENGAGKTTLMNFLKNHLESDYNKYEYEKKYKYNYNYILVYIWNNNIYCSNNIDQLKINDKLDKIIKNDPNDIPKILEDIYIYYFSNVIDINKTSEVLNRGSNLMDISSQYIFNKQLELQDASIYNNEMIKKIFFLLNFEKEKIITNKSELEWIKKVKEHIQIKFSVKDIDYDYLIERYIFNLKNKNIEKLSDEDFSKLKIFFKNLYKILSINFRLGKKIENIIYYFIINSVFDIIKESKIYKSSELVNNSINEVEYILEEFEEFFEKSNKIENGKDILNKFIEQFECKLNGVRLIKFLLNGEDKSSNEESMDFKVSINDNEEDIKNNILKEYCNIKNLRDIISITFDDLSSGQMAKITMYSRFYWATLDKKDMEGKYNIKGYLLDEIIDFRDNLIILLDEVEAFFHPEWQRCFIYDFISFTNNIFYKKDEVKNIQIFVTSNSAFIVSDLPHKNIIYLNKQCNNTDIETNTFAQNIYVLLKETFSMVDGVIGEFSRIQINNIINDLNGEELLNNEKENYIKNIINIIGEPVIKNKLNEMYREKIKNNRINDKDDIEKEIETLMEKIKSDEKYFILKNLMNKYKDVEQQVNI